MYWLRSTLRPLAELHSSTALHYTQHFPTNEQRSPEQARPIMAMGEPCTVGDTGQQIFLWKETGRWHGFLLRGQDGAGCPVGWGIQEGAGYPAGVKQEGGRFPVGGDTGR